MGNCLDICKEKTKTKDGGGGGANNNHKKQEKKRSSTIHSGGIGPSRHSLHDGLTHERNTDVYRKYEEVEVLGSGSMGHVAKVRVRAEGTERMRTSGSSLSGASGGSNDKSNNVENVTTQMNGDSKGDIITKKSGSSLVTEGRKVNYALKSIQLDRVSPSFLDELKNEIDILKAMDHPNIVRLHEVYHHQKQIYMILELCDGGDLYTKLPYSEKDAAYITGKLLSAIKYMHDHGIVHRDCKSTKYNDIGGEKGQWSTSPEPRSVCVLIHFCSLNLSSSPNSDPIII
jgi:serine/threonine protein kinase